MAFFKRLFGPKRTAEEILTEDILCASCQHRHWGYEVTLDSERVGLCSNCWDQMLTTQTSLQRNFAHLKETGAVPYDAPDRGICPGCSAHVGLDDRALLALSFYAPAPDEIGPKIFTAMSLCERCLVEMIPGMKPRVPALVEKHRQYRQPVLTTSPLPVPPQQTAAEHKPKMIGDARVVFALTASAANAFRQQGVAPIEFAAVGLAQASGSPEQVLKQPDGKLRLHPSRRNQVASMRVYSDANGSVIITDKAIDQPATTYNLDGKLNLMMYVSALCQRLGIAPESFLKPEVIETLSGPSRTHRCPHCGHLLTKGLSPAEASRFDTISGTATCSYCRGEFKQSDVYAGRYDVPQIRVTCPFCRKAWEGPAELLLGKPCRECKAELPLD